MADCESRRADRTACCTSRPRSQSICFALFSFALAISPAGCTPPVPPTVATGTVRLKGRPVASAVVTFSDRAAGVELAAKTDHTGRFTILSSIGPGSRPGLPPGDYRVTVVPVADTAAPPQGMTFDGPAPAHALANVARRDRDVKTTRLAATVRTGTNEFTFDLQPE